MREPDKTWRGRRLDGMTIAELKEMRDWVMDHGYHFKNAGEHMLELAAIDEHIVAAQRRK